MRGNLGHWEIRRGQSLQGRLAQLKKFELRAHAVLLKLYAREGVLYETEALVHFLELLIHHLRGDGGSRQPAVMSPAFVVVVIHNGWILNKKLVAATRRAVHATPRRQVQLMRRHRSTEETLLQSRIDLTDYEMYNLLA